MSAKDKHAQVSRFWEKYIEKSKNYNIKQSAVRWYVKHVEQYISAHQARLVTHSAADVDAYLQAKGRNTRLKDWQFCQIVDALRILFVDVVAAPNHNQQSTGSDSIDYNQLNHVLSRYIN